MVAVPFLSVPVSAVVHDPGLGKTQVSEEAVEGAELVDWLKEQE